MSIKDKIKDNFYLTKVRKTYNDLYFEDGMPEYLKKVTFVWRKMYKQLLLCFAFIGTVFILFIINYFIKINDITASEKLLLIIYFLTGIIIFWYTRETHDLKQVQQKELEEVRKQTELKTMPFLRLQFEEKDYDKERENNPILYLVNDGEGLARDIVMEEAQLFPEHDDELKVKINFDKIPVIASKKYTGIYPKNIKIDISVNPRITLNPKNEYTIKISYYNVTKSNIYKYKFIADTDYNDGFRIEKINV